MIASIIRQALNSWPRLRPGIVPPSQLETVLQSRDQVIIFYFDAESRSEHPVLISKIARTPMHNTKLKTSVVTMGRLREVLKDDMKETIPRSVLGGSIVDLVHIVMTPVQ
ncbi:MAG: hypothetical protein ACE5M4_13100, partial [Anaerolineales bacterium]